MLELNALTATIAVMAGATLWLLLALRFGPILWRDNRAGFFFWLFVALFATVFPLMQLALSKNLSSHEATVQAIATIVSTIVAVGGSILGAWWGAKVGADATLAAATRTIEAEVATARAERESGDRAALTAFAAECRVNADALSHRIGRVPEPSLLTPVRESALSQISLVVATLPPETRSLVNDVSGRLGQFNRVLNARMVALTSSSTNTERREHEQFFGKVLDGIATSLPDDLNRLADQIDEVVRCRVPESN